jgi:hypothetical protein
MVEWFLTINFQNEMNTMILINKKESVGITHKCNPERTGQIMTEKEIHEFGIELLIVYLYNQKGELISANKNLSNDYPHLVSKNPKGELLYIWIKTEMYPNIPRVESIDNPEESVRLSKQFNAIPVFAGIRLKRTSSKENDQSICGGQYIAEFTGFKMIGQ